MKLKLCNKPEWDLKKYQALYFFSIPDNWRNILIFPIPDNILVSFSSTPVPSGDTDLILAVKALPSYTISTLFQPSSLKKMI